MRTQTIILIFLLFGYTSAIPGMSTVGTEFVFSFPRFRHPHPLAKDITQIHIFVVTEEDSAKVNIEYPDHVDEEKTTLKTIDLERDKTVSISMNPLITLGKTGIFRAIHVYTTTPIRVIGQAIYTKLSAAGATRIIPFQSCHHSYYVTTPVGYPFMSVLAFSNNTRVTIKFPYHPTKYDVECEADKECTPNTTVTFVLKPYHVWHLQIERDEADLQNTMITSDFPVNVLAGSIKCQSKREGEMAKDLCVSSIKATVTWGKLYILPTFHSTVIHRAMRINSKTFPIELTIEGPSNSMNHTVQNHSELYIYRETSESVFVHAARPFGLYFLTPCFGNYKPDCSMVSLIPFEQWTNGIRYSKNNPDNFTNDTVRSILISSHGKEDDITSNLNLSWTRIGNYNGTQFSYAAITRNYSANFFAKAANVRMILYVTGFKQFAYFAYPYDFYHGEIYQDNCKRIAEVALSDGIDNDCDGKIDEELPNGKDDDNDDIIDEDIVEKYEDGKWAEWLEMCSIAKCTETGPAVKKKVRSCSKPRPSRFGKLCIGNSTTCTPHKTCDCDTTKNRWICNCKSGCADQQCNNESATCTGCNDGYFSRENCLVKCPKGYGGKGCSRYIGYVNDDDDDNEDDDGSSSWVVFIVIISALLLLIPIGLALLRFLVLKNKTEEEHKEETKEDMADEQHAEDVAEEVAEEARDAVGDEEGAEQEDEGLKEDHDE